MSAVIYLFRYFVSSFSRYVFSSLGSYLGPSLFRHWLVS